MRISFDNPPERAREKELERQALDAELASGRISHAEVNRRNHIFADVDFSKARIVIGDVVPVL
jgi:hypothetical protein